MKTQTSLLLRSLLVVVLAAATGCGRRKVESNELLGEWHARKVTTKVAGRADETKTYAEKQFVISFSPDGKFTDLDSGVPGETVVVTGSYEITKDHKLKETVLDVTGPKIAQGMKGRTGIMDFTVAQDQLTLVMQLVDPSGKKIGTTESTFVRAPK